MRILRNIDGLTYVPRRSAVSVGNFDGVHLGHRAIVHRLCDVAPPDAGVAVVTFEPHPLTVLRPDAAPPRLTSRLEKHRLLAEAGVTHLVELPPEPHVLGIDARKFWQLLHEACGPTLVAEGPDFRFGRGAAGTVSLLQDWALATNTRVEVLEPVEVVLPGLNIVGVSSSLIRWLLAYGRVLDAAACLGRPYTLSGRVVEGYKRGRTIGFPTANLLVGDSFVPCDGVYAGEIDVDGTTYAAAVSVGSAPTFGESARQIEAHLVGFGGDLYGRTLTLRLTRWVRGQQRFPCVEALAWQLHRDVADVRAGHTRVVRGVG